MNAHPGLCDLSDRRRLGNTPLRERDCCPHGNAALTSPSWGVHWESGFSGTWKRQHDVMESTGSNHQLLRNEGANGVYFSEVL